MRPQRIARRSDTPPSLSKRRETVEHGNAPCAPAPAALSGVSSFAPFGTPADVLALQRTVGNRAVQRLLPTAAGGRSVPAVVRRKIALDSAQLAGQVSWRGALTGGTASQVVAAAEKYQRAKTPLRELYFLVEIRTLIDRWLADAGNVLSVGQTRRETTLRQMRGNVDGEIDRLRITVMQTEYGLPPAFVTSVPLADLGCFAAANDALLTGDVAGADVALQGLQSAPAKAASGLVKQFLIRKHIGAIDPKLAKVIDDPQAKYRHKGSGRSMVRGIRQAEALTQQLDAGSVDHVTPGRPAFEQKKQHLPSGVKEGELQGIVSYTSDAYKGFNNPLRGDIGTQKFSKAQVDVTRLTVSGLNKLPAYTANGGRVYRHVGIFPGYVELNQVGGTFSDLGFMSTAASIKGAGAGGTAHDILEILDSRSGRDIAKLSAKGAQEAEVLFKPGTRFQVQKVAKVVNSKAVPADPFLQGFLDQDSKAKFLQYVIYKQEV